MTWYVSDCGQFLARRHDLGYDVFSMDGEQRWLSPRYTTSGRRRGDVQCFELWSKSYSATFSRRYRMRPAKPLRATQPIGVNGKTYQPVTTRRLLKAVQSPRRADDVGDELWPHLHGRGPTRGGPDACYVTAARMLGKLRRAGLVKQWFPSRFDHRWQITDAGRRYLSEAQ